MVELDVRTERRDCVTFVAATVHNDASVPRELSLRTDLRPVWPPRRQGVPAAGWDGDRVALTVPAGRSRGVGFATPAEPTEPVLTVEESEPAGRARRDPEPDDVVRTLGDPTPPADAVPVGDAVSDGDGDAIPDGDGAVDPASAGGEAAAHDGPGDRTRPPRAVAAWLDALEARERVTDRDRADVAAVAERATALAGRLADR